MSIRTKLNGFLGRVQYININQLPYNGNVQILAIQSRSNGRVQRLTGYGLMKQNLVREAHRLQIFNRYLINLAMDHIWNIHSTSSQRSQFINLASDANDLNRNHVSRGHCINTPNTLELISRLPVPQISNDIFEQNLFNGAVFCDGNNFESLLSPSECFLESSSFP
ncbi:6635_t:CDS:1 [Funneliformis geosporum]|uniref:875_t:CDS:1 n=1 Tax=Funneliformis geosporum TaxID=1117311 RepID=A0A9W4SCE3_9GLOM|nr:875_t:CDS:1 [Funneliformis geosporum]CAI2174807.1 6635_t:CDS:1 [Funneliformis geosporum]